MLYEVTLANLPRVSYLFMKSLGTENDSLYAQAYSYLVLVRGKLKGVSLTLSNIHTLSDGRVADDF